jgi:acyl transferase domain-containing protein/acyl carrier protein
MNDFLQRIAQLPPKRLALLAMELRSQLDERDRARTEPIAVIGMGCRFPGGASDPDEFWRVLRDGVDAIGEVPPERWDIEAYYDPDPDVPGKMSARYGGFLGDVRPFDASFFGISPREATSLDPQQRLLLETSWEALEHAGHAPDRLQGSRIGVFVGISSSDYGQQQIKLGDPAHFDAYFGTGTAPSVAAGRLAYSLGLQGPCMAIDTACSSSLVAIHLACQSLREGESEMAIAAGVNLLLAPEVNVALSKAHMLSPDGRCKTFDASADGYVRSEGCGVVVLKPLSKAVKDGDRVLALIRGSAINQDGRSGGLTVPNGPAQQELIRRALDRAGVSAADVAYVEAHGTGTSLGDPIEAHALGAVFGAERSAQDPLLVGSVKTNLGHLEAAAGIAGLIKVVLALQHGEIPPHLHFTTPSPHIDWDAINARVPTGRTPWPVRSGRRLAGLSSFGFSGTNAHVVLEEAPEPVAPAAGPVAERPRHILTLSAKNVPALRELAAKYERYLATSGTSLADTCYTAATGRAHFAHRLAVSAASMPEVTAALRAFQDGDAPATLAQGEATKPGPIVSFLFSGQGAQYAAMGRRLFETQPVFREAIERCDRAGTLVNVAILEHLYGGADLEETAAAQPALFAVEYALAELWRSWGVQPHVLAGHSLGEYVAACVAGIFSLEDALKLVAARARLMQRAPEGAMAAILTDESTVRRLVAEIAPAASIAAINGPSNTVVAGTPSEVERVMRAAAAAGIAAKQLRVRRAFHSALMDGLLDEFEQVAAEVTYHEPRIPVVAMVTGAIAKPGELASAEYWRRQVREPVRFKAAVETLAAHGSRVFLEVGPGSTLVALGRNCVTDDGAAWLTSLRNERDDWEEVLTSLAALHVRGVDVNWVAFDQPYARRRVQLPTYAFQRQAHWIEGLGKPARRRSSFAGTGSHPLLGTRLHSPRLTGAVWETELSVEMLPYLDDHRVHGVAVVPASVFIELAIAAASASGSPATGVADVAIAEALVLPDHGARLAQVAIAGASTGDASFEIFSADADAAEPTWQLHATGRLVTGAALQADGTALDDAVRRCAAEMPADAYYERLASVGLALGARFRAISTIHRRDGEATADIALPAGAGDAARYRIHPVVLDACLSSLGAAWPERDGRDTYLLTRIARFELAGDAPAQVRALAVLDTPAEPGAERVVGSVRLFDSAGAQIGRVEGAEVRRIARDTLVHRDLGDWLYEVAWERKGHAGARSAQWVQAPAEIAGALKGDVLTAAADPDVLRVTEWLPHLEALSTGYVVRAFEDLGMRLQVGDRLARPALEKTLGIADAQRRLFRRLLGMLEEDEVLRARGAEEWEVIAAPSTGDIDAETRTLSDGYPEASAELTLVVRCGERLADVLRGTADPIQLLFPGGSFETLERLYQDSPVTRTYQTLMRRAIETAIAAVPPTRTVSILEVGAGTGSTTAAVLPVLGDRRVRYAFSDVSPLFAERAADKFGAHSFVEYRVLDAETDPLAQGFAPGEFDVIIAANVLHATRDLRATLSGLRPLLAPGGLLALIEAVRPQRSIDITFGLTDGWWRFTDADLRTAHPLVSPEQWLTVLGQSGFESSVALPEGGDPRLPLASQALVLARAPQQAVAKAAGPADARRWIICADTGGVGSSLARRLRARGDEAVLLFGGATAAGAEPGSLAVDPADAAAVRGALATLVNGRDASRTAVLHLWNLDALESDITTPVALQAAEARGTTSVVCVAQALAAASLATPLWIVTRGAQSLPGIGDNTPISPVQAAAWGLGRVLALEHPELWGGLIDLGGEAPDEAAETLLHALAIRDDEDQVAVRQGDRYVARISRLSHVPDGAAPIHSDASYLVTGGLGRLGLKVARWLAEQGARHLTLLGRRGLSTDADPEFANRAQAVRDIEALGVRVRVVAADVADVTAMQDLMGTFGGDRPPLRGVVHTAAALGSGSLEEMTPATLAAMLRPKADGAWVLDRVTRDLELDFFLLFSSTTGLLGSRELGHYAAANTFLDALAWQRRAAGRPAVSVNWGVWDAMRLDSAEGQRLVSASGLRPMSSERALAAFGRLLASDRPQTVVAAVDWDALIPVFEARRRRPFFDRLRIQHDTSRKSAMPARASVIDRVRSAKARDRRDVLVEYIRGEAARVLGHDAAQLDVRQGLFDMGLDSLMSVELKSRLEKGLGHKLPTTLTFNYPTVEAIASFVLIDVPGLVEPVVEREAIAPPAAAPPQDAPATALDDLSEDELATMLASRLAGIGALGSDGEPRDR